MPTPFDGSIAGVFWTGRSVADRSVSALVRTLKTLAPNMNAIYVKTSDGPYWQARYDTLNPGLTMSGPPNLAEWVSEAKAAGIQIHAWAVLKGDDAGGEAQRVLEACSVPGLRSMLLDVEDGHADFSGGAENVRRLALAIRRGLPPDFHLGLILDPRGEHVKHIYLEEWLPHMQSLHPMVYHSVFGLDPRTALQESLQALRPLGKPIVPMLQAFDDAQPEDMLLAGRTAFGLGAAGLSYFRLGAINREGFAAIRQVERPAVIVTAGRPLMTGDPDPTLDGAVIVRPGQPGYAEGEYREPAGEQRWQEMVDIHGWTVRYKRTSPEQRVYASYAPDLPAAGMYAIEVFVPSARADTRSALYFVSYYEQGERQERKIALDQSLYYNQWASLGYFQLDPAQGDSGRVNLVDYSIEDPPRWISFSPIRWRPVNAAEVEPTPSPEEIAEPGLPPVADGFDAPIGTPEERAAGQLWPGRWKDAWHPKSGYAKQYRDSAGNIAYHTGADLNLNEPRFNLDRGTPIVAIASGTVAFAGRVGSYWRNIVIIQHDPASDGARVCARYAHVDNMRVSVGERVQRGQPIAVVGTSGGAAGNYHLHFDLSPTEVLLGNPGHWPGTNLKEVLAHYTDPIEFIRNRRPEQA